MTVGVHNKRDLHSCLSFFRNTKQYSVYLKRLLTIYFILIFNIFRFFYKRIFIILHNYCMDIVISSDVEELYLKSIN